MIFINIEYEITHENGTKTSENQIDGFHADKEAEWMLDKKDVRKSVLFSLRVSGKKFKKLKILSCNFCDNPMNNKK